MASNHILRPITGEYEERRERSQADFYGYDVSYLTLLFFKKKKFKSSSLCICNINNNNKYITVLFLG